MLHAFPDLCRGIIGFSELQSLRYILILNAVLSCQVSEQMISGFYYRVLLQTMCMGAL